MLNVELRLIGAVDLQSCRILPRSSRITISYEIEGGLFGPLWTQHGRSYPTLNPMEAEGAKLVDGCAAALSAAEAEQVALKWIRENLLKIENGSDNRLMYPRSFEVLELEEEYRSGHRE